MSLVKYVIQGESGIPYAFFDPDTWKLKLFGLYARPYYSTQYIPRYWGFQEDLKQAYVSSIQENGSQKVLSILEEIYPDSLVRAPPPSHVSWGGIVPLHFDYGGLLTIPEWREYTSALQYGVNVKYTHRN